MKSTAFIRILAGSMILLSVALAHFVSPWWLLFTCFVALNLIQSAFTGFCPPEWLARRLGWIAPDGDSRNVRPDRRVG
ncbi:MAG TPA: DUF2892 domain-containing protein [Rariglobus sp.]